MKKIKFYLWFIIPFILTLSCTFDNIYINREEDNKDGKRALNTFYKQISEKNFDVIQSKVSDNLESSSGPNGIKKMLIFIQSKLGSYKSYSIQDKYIKCTVGSTNETSYNYKLKVTYDKGTIEEIVGLIKRNNSEIKLNSYHANSDLLIQ